MFDLDAHSTQKALNRSVIVSPNVLDLLRCAGLLQPQEFLELRLGVRTVVFRGRQEKRRDRDSGIGARRIGPAAPRLADRKRKASTSRYRPRDDKRVS